MKDYKLLTEDILKLMGRKNYVPMRLIDIALSIGVERKDLPYVKKAISILLDSGSIAKVKGEKFALTSDIGLISGIIEFKQNGSAVIEHDGKLYTVNRENTATAFHKDKVLARVVNSAFAGKRDKGSYRQSPMQAKVIRILEHNTKSVIGTLRRTGSTWHLVPDDPKFYYDVILASPRDCGLDPIPDEDDKVLALLDEWNQKHLNPSGKIIECFGSSHTPMSEYKAILRKYDLPETFDDRIKEEVKKIPTEVSAKDLSGRLDIRDAYTITIDPVDAKDFDDALSIRKVGKGIIEIGVHIADVSYYVKPNSIIDREALKRGNSTYLVGTVIPMLPFELSNGICSLVEGKDRLVKSVFLSFDSKGDCVGVSYANSVINSKKRLSYEQAYAMLKESDLSKIRGIKSPEEYETAFSGKSLSSMSDKELQVLRIVVRHMWSLASQLRNRRMKKGSLDLEMPEVKIFCDENGYASSIEKVENNESHQLVEEFMLAANEAVARDLSKAKIPFISRVHDNPDEEKLEELALELETFDIFCGDLTNRNNVMYLLKIINKHQQNYLLKTKFLRSLKRAVYRASADGHYGLYKDFYTHFTSPIRRYSDFTTHRILDFYMQLNRIATASKVKKPFMPKKSLENIAEHISRTERNSTEAERDSVKIKLMEFFERQIGKNKQFEAIITKLTSFGFFVELVESMAFGFVHSHSLQDDIYRINDKGTALVGRRTRRQYKIGEKIKVKIEAVDRFKRQIDFTI